MVDALTGQARERRDEIDGWRNGTSLTRARERRGGNRQEDRRSRRSGCKLQRTGIDRCGGWNRILRLRVFRLALAGEALTRPGSGIRFLRGRCFAALHRATRTTSRSRWRFTSDWRNRLAGELRLLSWAGTCLRGQRGDRGRNREHDAQHRSVMATFQHGGILRNTEGSGQQPIFPDTVRFTPSRLPELRPICGPKHYPRCRDRSTADRDGGCGSSRTPSHRPRVPPDGGRRRRIPTCPPPSRASRPSGTARSRRARTNVRADRPRGRRVEGPKSPGSRSLAGSFQMRIRESSTGRR